MKRGLLEGDGQERGDSPESNASDGSALQPRRLRSRASLAPEEGTSKKIEDQDFSQPLSINTEESQDAGPAKKRPRFMPSGGRKSVSSGPSPGVLASPGVTWLTAGRRDRMPSATGHRAEKPDELFSKNLISAMKMADTEQLQPDQYLVLADAWRQDWERGVQVPVGLDSAPQLRVSLLPENESSQTYGAYGFKLPGNKKYLHAARDENYRSAVHELHESHKLAEDVCRYDMDDLDSAWLTALNSERLAMGEDPVAEWVLEQVMEQLEDQCYNNMQNKIKTEQGLGIEYDENIDCDVCKSPEGEEDNEMVFCDNCDICVHQACYGVPVIPEGSWLCRLCALGMCHKTTPCIFCPNTGGAMKSTKSGNRWAHVSCAWWIPEVNFGNPEKMEPITNISAIPASRWNLVCCVCRQKSGACIQCSVKQCKTAFHVTCAFADGLDMRTVIDEEQEILLLKGYCKKHSKKSEGTPKKSVETAEHTPKKESEMTEQERSQARTEKLAALCEEFYECVTVDDVAQTLTTVPSDVFDVIFAYWMLKRKAYFNQPLITPRLEEAELLEQQRQDSLLSRMNMFIHLRQDLERVRNLCYMVTKREKMTRTLNRLKEQVFFAQLKCLGSGAHARTLPEADYTAITTAHRLPSCVYDRYDFIARQAKKAEHEPYAALLALRAQADVQAQAAARLPAPSDKKCRLAGAKRGAAGGVVGKDSAQKARQLQQDKARQALNKAKQMQHARASKQHKQPLKPRQTQQEKGGGDVRTSIVSESHVLQPVDVKSTNNSAETEALIKDDSSVNSSVDTVSTFLGRRVKLSEKARALKETREQRESQLSERSKASDSVGGNPNSEAAQRRPSRRDKRAIGDVTSIESNGLVFKFKTSDLIVSDEIKDKVQTRFALARHAHNAIQGICKHAQRFIPGFLKRKVSDLESAEDSPTKMIENSPKKLIEVQSSRLQTSPKAPLQPRGVTLVRTLDSDAESNEKVDDEVSIRSSRENTPDPAATRLTASPGRGSYARMLVEHRRRLRMRQEKQRKRRGVAASTTSESGGEDEETAIDSDNTLNDTQDSDFIPFAASPSPQYSDTDDFEPGSSVNFKTNTVRRTRRRAAPSAAVLRALASGGDTEDSDTGSEYHPTHSAAARRYSQTPRRSRRSSRLSATMDVDDTGPSESEERSATKEGLSRQQNTQLGPGDAIEVSGEVSGTDSPRVGGGASRSRIGSTKSFQYRSVVDSILGRKGSHGDTTDITTLKSPFGSYQQGVTAGMTGGESRSISVLYAKRPHSTKPATTTASADPDSHGPSRDGSYGSSRDDGAHGPSRDDGGHGPSRDSSGQGADVWRFLQQLDSRACYRCTLCDKTIRYSAQAELHVRTQHARELSGTDLEPLASLMCNGCGRCDFRNIVELDMHICNGRQSTLESQNVQETAYSLREIANLAASFTPIGSLTDSPPLPTRINISFIIHNSPVSKKIDIVEPNDTESKVETLEDPDSPKTVSKFSPSALDKYIERVKNVESAFRCKLCSRVLSSLAYVRRHIEAMHSKRKPDTCKKCGRTFMYKTAFTKHQKRCVQTPEASVVNKESTSKGLLSPETNSSSRKTDNKGLLSPETNSSSKKIGNKGLLSPETNNASMKFSDKGLLSPGIRNPSKQSDPQSPKEFNLSNISHAIDFGLPTNSSSSKKTIKLNSSKLLKKDTAKKTQLKISDIADKYFDKQKPTIHVSDMPNLEVSSAARELTFKSKFPGQTKEKASPSSANKTHQPAHSLPAKNHIKSYRLLDNESFEESVFARHIETLADGRYRCRLCPCVVAKRTTAMMHVECVHVRLRRYTCGQCGSQFLWRTSLEKHMKSHLPKEAAFSPTTSSESEGAERGGVGEGIGGGRSKLSTRRSHTAASSGSANPGGKGSLSDTELDL